MGVRHGWGDWLIGNKPDFRFGWVSCNKRTLHNKWVYRLNEEDRGKKRYKARIVLKGFPQKKGIDFDEIFSPIV